MNFRSKSRRHNGLAVETLESRCLLTALGSVNSGIGVADDATGTGYLMFTEQDVQARFSPPPVIANSQKLIAVRYQNNGWQYNDNTDWHAFTPVSTDHLLAEVDFDADTVTPLHCIGGAVNGINQGFSDAPEDDPRRLTGSIEDLSFVANEWNEKSNDGEFTIYGNEFEKTWTHCAVVLAVTPDSSEADLVTNDGNVVLNGRYSPQVGLEIDFNGTVYTPADTELTTSGADWTLDLSATTLTHGIYPIAIDVDGVTDVALDTLVIDTGVPVVNVSTVLTDTANGTTAFDFITSDNRLIVLGTYTQGSHLEVLIDGTTYDLFEDPQLSSGGNGTWALDLTSTPLAGGNYTVLATVTDLAGNSSTDSQSLDIVTATIDTVTEDRGPVDFITDDQEIVLSGTVTPGASITIDIDGSNPSFPDQLGLVPTVSGNSWTLDRTSVTLPLDSYEIRANVVHLGEAAVVSRSLELSDDCFYVESYDLRDPDDNPISSLATVGVDLAGNPTVGIDLNARKTTTSNIFYVDDNYQGTVSGTIGSATNPFDDISTAFDQISGVGNATINAGTYTWGYQSSIGFDLNIIGAGIGQTVVKYDDALWTDPGNSANKYTAQFRQNSTYIEGITFDGDDGVPNTESFIVMDVRNADALTIVNSEFVNAGTGDGLNVFNTETVVVYGSIASNNFGDGFSYSNPDGMAMEVFEAFVDGSNNGTSGLWQSQGSTTHESVDIVRVGGVFTGNPTNISDVSSGTSWNVGVTTADATANEQAGQYLNFNVSGGGTAWIVAGDHSGFAAKQSTNGG